MPTDDNYNNFIRKYNQKHQTTVLLTSHYMDDIRELCERVIIINFGRILFDGKLADLIAKYAKDKIIRLTLTEPVATDLLAAFGAIEENQEIRASLRVPREEVKAVASKLIASTLPIDDILIDEMPIDDIIRLIFQEQPAADN